MDTQPSDRLANLSQVVLQLHRGSREWPSAAFAPRACELLATLLPFDACLWASTRADAPADAPLSLQGLHAEGIGPELLGRCLAGSGQMPTLLARYVEPLAARRIELRLWRHDGSTAKAAEQETLDFLMPHLVEAQRENRLGRAYEAEAAPPARRSHVLCDGEGVLQQVDEHGLALLRAEWPRWCASRLPESLVRAVSAAATADHAQGPGMLPFHGRQITVLITRSGEAWLLEVRRRSSVDRLSTRQHNIALLYAQGHTGPQIASQLGLSPSTVNNHLGVIFKKLSVSNKVQLLHAMRRL